MNTRKFLSAALVMLAVLVLPAAGSAQKLEAGKWTVAVTTPNGENVELAFDVSEANGAPKAVMTAAFLPGPVEVGNLKLEGRTLTFTFDVESTSIKCTLERNDAGGFGGPCTDAVSPPGRFEMKPPSAAAPGAAPAAARLEAGKWTGSVQHPSMGAMAFDFDVPTAADAKPTMNIPSLPMSFTIERLMVDGRKLTFGFVVEGQGDVRCELNQRDDRTYAGSCVEGGGETSPVTMKPPAPKG